jgi:diketogulonate reductase-like aldo/keto reductase
MTFIFPFLIIASALPLSEPAFATFDSSEIPSSPRTDDLILQNNIRMTRLSNHQMIPLVGFGAGNVPRSHVGALVAEAIQPDKRIYLFDTARESKNEALIAEGIVAGAERFNIEEVKTEIHVITKVWYTHLGYNRTKLAVEDSLEAFRDAMESDKVDVRLHIQLHYPRCYESIEWMDCDNEEVILDERVKQVGPNPRQDPTNSLKGSWTYLEDLYLSANFPVASIGVSNFALADLEAIREYARVQPHTLQINMWSVLYDPLLVEHCRRHNIHVQVYNALQSTMKSLEHVAKAVPSLEMTPGQTVISWLVEQNISVFPRTSK